jgi:hypothetical protein
MTRWIGLAIAVGLGAVTLARAQGASAAQVPRLPSLGSLTQPTPNDYRGTIEFLWEIRGPHGWSKERWSASVDVSGVQCTGTSDISSDGQVTHVDLRGPGLFHITFDPARGQYTFEVACPDSTHPSKSSWTDTNSSASSRARRPRRVRGTAERRTRTARRAARRCPGVSATSASRKARERDVGVAPDRETEGT